MPENLIGQGCTEMSKYLAAILTRAKFDPDAVIQTGEIISGWAISTSEKAEFLFCDRLDLAVRGSDQKRTLVTSTDAFHDHFAAGHYDEYFPDIMEAYLDFVDWRGEVPTKRSFFQPPNDHRAILTVLAGLRYLKTTDHGVCWTDKVGQAMLRIGAWNDDFQSHDELKELEKENHAREIAANLSSDLIALARSNPEVAFWPVFQNIYSDPWYKQEPNKLVVERVIEIVRSKAFHGKTALN